MGPGARGILFLEQIIHYREGCSASEYRKGIIRTTTSCRGIVQKYSEHAFVLLQQEMALFGGKLERNGRYYTAIFIWPVSME